MKKILLVLPLVYLMHGCCLYPPYNVWEQRLQGEAELARASSNRKIAVNEAQAKKEAAASLAQAEVIRAGGVAKANKIIGDSLKGNDAYLHYLWVQTLEHNTNASLIYIPTENQLPLLEANRLHKEK